MDNESWDSVAMTFQKRVNMCLNEANDKNKTMLAETKLVYG